MREELFVGKYLELEARALQLRIDSLRATAASASGHPTTCLSAADIVSALFFKIMNFNVSSPDDLTNDRFILSKGHGVPVVYAAYRQLGVLSDEDFMKLREFDSPLEGHPTPRFVYNEAATGSLGQGLAIGAGMVLHAHRDKLAYKTYVLLGDGEVAEGSVWEAAEFASYYNLNSLTAIVDCNRLGQTGQTLYGHDVEKLAEKFRAFGWRTVVIDGHDIEQIVEELEKTKTSLDKPTAIVAKTYKGHGVDSFQDKNGFHGKPVKAEELGPVIQHLKNRFVEANQYLEREIIVSQKKVDLLSYTKKSFSSISIDITTDMHSKLFEKTEKLATRKAFGYALASLGRVCSDIEVLDADVKNSTFTEIFEKEFPDRLTQCFIAEQTMIGVATGLQARGKIPFAATFAAFLTRAHDQIRMAGIGCNALRLCGSHAGVSIGEDGPSQMGLEDLSMMRSVPRSIVLYPSDAVSTYKLVERMANYNAGISYLRTTRSATPILYKKDELFEVGGCKVLRESDNDQACLVAAGITVHEALKAYEILKEKNIFVSVIDAYSIKPIDSEMIKKIACKSGNNVITIEDHYIEGGLGEAVAAALINDPIVLKILAVTKLSRSGKPDELLAYAGIDAASIVSCFE